jgi:hypothetical protein
MNAWLQRNAIAGLRWTLGVVVLLESCRLAFVSSQTHSFWKGGPPHAILTALAGSEILAALLFLVPFTSILGGYLLLAVFGVAAAIHVLHGQLDVGFLVVYGAAVLVCLAHREGQTGEAAHDRS